MYESTEHCIQDAVHAMGFELYHLMAQTTPGGVTWVVLIDHADGIGIDDCVAVTRQIRHALQVYDPNGDVRLEVSSPGLNRGLYTTEHFQAQCNQPVAFRLKSARSGKKRKGVIVQTPQGLVVEEAGSKERWSLDALASAELIPQFKEPL